MEDIEGTLPLQVSTERGGGKKVRGCGPMGKREFRGLVQATPEGRCQAIAELLARPEWRIEEVHFGGTGGQPLGEVQNMTPNSSAARFCKQANPGRKPLGQCSLRTGINGMWQGVNHGAGLRRAKGTRAQRGQ